MSFDDCYLLGHLVKTHGLRGELIAHLDVDYPEEYQKLESVFVDLNGKLIPFFIESISIQGEKAYVAFDDIESKDDASELAGASLYLPLDNLPDLPEGGYYFHQLVGLNVFDKGQEVGVVTQLYDLPNNRLLGVDHKGVEALVPLDSDMIVSVDLSSGQIQTDLPEGFLEVFLNN